MLVIGSGIMVRHCIPIVYPCYHSRSNVLCLASSCWPPEPVVARQHPGTPYHWLLSRQSCPTVRMKIKQSEQPLSPCSVPLPIP